LAAADRHHRVDRLVAGLHRLRHALAIDDARRHALDRRGARGLDRALAVDRIAERIDYAAEQLRAHRHFEDAPGRLDRIALADALVLTEHDRTDRVLLEVEGKAEHAARVLDHLAVAHIGKTVDARDAVRDR